MTVTLPPFAGGVNRLSLADVGRGCGEEVGMSDAIAQRIQQLAAQHGAEAVLRAARKVLR